MGASCVHCHKPVTTWTPQGYSTTWIHLDGRMECRPTHAAPHFDDTEVSWEKAHLAAMLADALHYPLDIEGDWDYRG
jgi:hypothetical protein